MAGGACVAVMLLMCALGGEALNLLRVTTTSGNPPSTPTVHCWCASYPNMTFCSWPEPSHSPPLHYIATYSEKHRESPDQMPCHLIQPGSSSSVLGSPSDQLWHCHMPHLKLLTDYIINVTAVYPGASSSHLASFMLEDIVKPDPPINVRVSPQHNKTLVVEWSPPSSWAYIDIFPLKYQILYQWDHRGSPVSVKRGPYERTWVDMKGMVPGRTYQFQVCAMELLGFGECSDWSSPVNITVPKL